MKVDSILETDSSNSAGYHIEKKEDDLYRNDVFIENSNESFNNIDINEINEINEPINENAEGALENFDFEKGLYLKIL